MARKKVSPLVQAMALFAQMDERDKQTLADYVRTQTATPRKKAAKAKKDAPPLLTDATKDQQSNAA